MKHQYFGDIRDLFKYDLLIVIAKNVSAIQQVVFIPLLTADDGKNHGNKRDYSKAKAGTRNDRLLTFLENCARRGDRNLALIREYFESTGISLHLHMERFTHRTRQDYEVHPVKLDVFRPVIREDFRAFARSSFMVSRISLIPRRSHGSCDQGW